MADTRPFPLVVLALLVLPGSAVALDLDCKFQAARKASLDTRGAERVEIEARAGELTVKPATGTRLSAAGQACASSEKLLQETQLELRRDGDVIRVLVQVPSDMRGIGIFYASLDLDIAVPTDLPIAVTDSSGDTTLEGVRVTRVLDSSGDLELRRTLGDVEIDDSSGDIRVEQAAGSVSISDSSGDILVRDARDVLIRRDSSGDIDLAQVSGNVRIEQDSSGQVRVSDVTGTVEVP